MSVKRLSESRYRVEVSIRVNGRITHRERVITGTKEEAKALEQKIKAELRECAGCSLTVATTFENALQFYLDRHEVGRSKCLFDRLKSELGPVKIAELGDRFDRWFMDLRARKSNLTERLFTNATCNRHLTHARAALNFAVRHGLISKNPLQRFEKLREVSRDVTFSDTDELNLLNAIDAEAPHLRPVVRFMLQVPCRRSEVVNMRRGDVDLFNNCIRVRNGTTKNDAGIDKPIPPDLVDYMRSIPAQSEFVFFRKVGGNKRNPIEKYETLGDIKHAWATCTKTAGLTGLRIHDLRHIAATRLVDQGTPEQVVMAVAGWKTNMLRVYYNRNPKKALELVHFRHAVNGSVNGPKVGAL